MGAPYYGAYFAALALAQADHIAPLDDMKSNYAAYAIYKGAEAVRVLLYNSDYYVSGTRSVQNFTITGLPATSTAVSARRLTAPYATSRQDQGQNPTVAGQTFGNGTCLLQGSEVIETVAVVGGVASIQVFASEAVLVDL
jgi:hypothetical protein